jgi:hypothetical protein
MADQVLNRMFRDNPDFVLTVTRDFELSMYPWKDTPEKIPLAVHHVRSFLLSHRAA